MKTKFVNVFAAFIAVAAFSLPAFGQDAKSLDELLQMIESSSISETADSRPPEGTLDNRDIATVVSRESDCLRQLDLKVAPGPRSRGTGVNNNFSDCQPFVLHRLF